MNILHESATDPMAHTQQMEFEEIDIVLCKMMEKAEMKCRKLCTGIIKWSPTYKKLH